MTPNELTARVAAILTTLEETNSGTPESNLYLFCGTNMDDWLLVRRMLVNCGYVTITSSWVELTEKGREVAEKINGALKNAAPKENAS